MRDLKPKKVVKDGMAVVSDLWGGAHKLGGS